MSQCATWFVEITCQNDQQAVLLAYNWRQIEQWCGLLASHGPVHYRHNRLIVMAYGGQLDVRKVPFQVVKIQEFCLADKFDANHFVWPDQPHNPWWLRGKTVFDLQRANQNGGRPQSTAVSTFLGFEFRTVFFTMPNECGRVRNPFFKINLPEKGILPPRKASGSGWCFIIQSLRIILKTKSYTLAKIALEFYTSGKRK